MNKDKIIRFLAHNGTVNVICASTTNLVEEARKIHSTNPTPTAAFGRLLTMASIMGTSLKNKSDRLSLKIKGSGPIEGMVVAVNSSLELKGYVYNPLVELPLREDGKLNVGGIVGKEGYINVVKDIGMGEPYVGNSPLVTGEIAEDFANYFVVSEQKPSVVALGVLVDKTGEVLSAGGYFITTMPDVKEETIEIIENAIKNAKPISSMLKDNMSLEEIAKICTGDEKIKKVGEELTPSYKCDCSRERIERGLISIGEEELEKLIEEDGKAEVTCNFCLKKYDFSKEELEDLKEQATSKE